MEMSVRVLCRPAIAAGFELAGLGVTRAAPAEAGEALGRIADDPDAGVVLVEEELRGSLPSPLLRRIERRGSPLLVYFPSPAWGRPSTAEDQVLEVLRQAVGYRVRSR